jgi:protein TonB
VALEHFKKQVLLLHNEQATLDDLSKSRSDRYTVHCAASGSEALNYLGETEIDIFISTQQLPGMSGLDALREAHKRSPETLGILLAGSSDEGLEALVGDGEFFQVVHGEVTVDALKTLIEDAIRQSRLVTMGSAANDPSADVDQPAMGQSIAQTAPDTAATDSDDSDRYPAEESSAAANADRVANSIDIVVLTRDEDFLATIRESVQGSHNVIEATTVGQADRAIDQGNTGVAIVDAAMVGSRVEKLVTHLRDTAPRLVGIVAGRRDDGEMLMDLINRGKVYRFLMKPVSPGRSRLAIEAAIKHHLEAADASCEDKSPSSSVEAPRKAPSAAEPAQPSEATTQAQAISNTSPKSVARQGDKSGRGTRDHTGRTDTRTRSDQQRVPDKTEGRLSESGAHRTAIAGDVAAATADRSSADSATATAGKKPLQRKIVAGAIVMGIATAGLAWLFIDFGDPASAPEQTLAGGTPTVTEVEFGADAPGFGAVDISGMLNDAQLAVESGRVFSPPGDNAIEILLAALALAPDDEAAQNGLQDAVASSLGLAETALLEGRADDAEVALQQVSLADPENQRLPFLAAQLSQVQARNYLDEARVAIRESRFEDAGSHIESARALSIGDDGEIAAVSDELDAAISAEQTEDLLAKAQSRLAQNRLLTPSNDNARYYYEMALSKDPGNAVAQQGLETIASKLTLLARLEIDRGEFQVAENLLADARRLVPTSAEINATYTALQVAKDRVAQQRREAAQRAAAERAAAERAAAERLAEERAAIQAAERATAETTTADSSVAEQAAADPSAAEMTAVQQVAVDTPAIEPKAVERPAAEPSMAEPATDESPAAATEMASGPADDAANAATSGDAAQPEQVVTAPAAAPVSVSSLNRTKYVAPKYPRGAQRRGITGWVDVVFTVDTDGTVAEVTIRNSEPGETFVASAVKAVEGWEFEPVVEDGVAVRKVAGVRMLFAME